MQVSSKDAIPEGRCDTVREALRNLTADEEEEGSGECTETEEGLHKEMAGVDHVSSERFVEAVTSSLVSRSLEKYPLVIIVFLMCHSEKISDEIIEKLASRADEETVQKLRNKLLIISVKAQWPATESTRMIDTILTCVRPDDGVEQHPLRLKIHDLLVRDQQACRRQGLIHTSESEWHTDIRYSVF